MRKILVFLAMIACVVPTFGADVHLTQFGPFHSPIGIDYQETSGRLVISVNYASGLPNNLETVNTSNGSFAAFSTLAGRQDEIKVATVRTSPGCQQFPVGDVFVTAGSNHPGEIVRIDKNGTIYPPAGINGIAGSWVKLPGETGLIRGSLFVDRFCAWGGDLIVGTGDAGIGAGTGNIWRVKVTGAASLVAHLPSVALPASQGALIEGLITLPNNVQKYGPWAGAILAGDENLEDNITLDGTLWAIAATGPCPTGIVQASGACAKSYNLSYNDASQGNRHHPVKPEDLDVIEAGSAFFGLDWGENQMLRAPASDFSAFVGDILLTQETPLESPNSTGLYVIHWNPTFNNGAGAFFVTELKFAAGGAVQHVHEWEHVTLAPISTPNLITVTQGGWGAPPHGNNPAQLLQDNFSSIGPVVVGCTFKLTFNSSVAIENFLPAGGTPGVLTANALNPTSSAAGVFAGQVTALQISVSFSNAGKLPAGLASFVIPTGAAAGKTVGQVLTDANNALGGCGLPSYVTSISQLNDVVTSINEMFD